MKKSFSMAAAMMAAAVLSVFTFVSCEEEEENKNVFESKTFTVELPVVMGTSYGWEWTNSNEAAAATTGDVEIIQKDTLQVGGPGKEVWTFKTKDNGEEVLKFRYLKYFVYSDTMRRVYPDTGKEIVKIFYSDRHWDESTVVKDTVITFKK